VRLAQKGSAFPLKTESPQTVSGKRLQGFLRVTASPDGIGRTVLARKAHRTPIHVSKPYWNGSSLLLNVMSPTAGMLEGDRVEMNISVESNANLVVSNPTALRIHKMSTGKAVWKQVFRVASEGFLETHPEWITPQAQSRFEQHSRIEIDTNGRLFFIEALAPGRVASGEAFAFDRFQNRLEVHFESRLIALEQSDITPPSQSQSGWQAAYENPYTYSLYVSAPELVNNDEFFQFIHEQQTPTLLSGSSKLGNAPCWNIKIMSESSVEAKAALGLIREQFYRAIDLPTVDLRK